MFHFCHEELIALLLLVPGIKYIVSWIKSKFSHKCSCPRVKKLSYKEQILKLETELDASTTWNKCIESTFAKEIARVNSAMMRAFQERDEARKELETLKKQIEKQNKKQQEKPKEPQQ